MRTEWPSSSNTRANLTPLTVTLPQTVLKQVFKLYADAEVELGPLTPPHCGRLETLLLVSRQWNEVARGYSLLWEQFNITISVYTNLERLLQLITRRLKRLSPTPQIKIRIGFRGSNKIDHTSQALAMVLRTLAGPDGALYSRWTTLHISLTELTSNSGDQTSLISSLNQALGHELVRLKSLSINSPSDLYNRKPYTASQTLFINARQLQSIALGGLLLVPSPEPEQMEEISLAGVTMQRQWSQITSFPKLRVLRSDVLEDLLLEAPLLGQLTVNTAYGRELNSFAQISHIHADKITHLEFHYVNRILRDHTVLTRNIDVKSIYRFLTQNKNLQYIEGPELVLLVVLSWAYETWFGSYSRSGARRNSLCLQSTWTNSPRTIVLTGAEDLGQLQQIAAKCFNRPHPDQLAGWRPPFWYYA